MCVRACVRAVPSQARVPTWLQRDMEDDDAYDALVEASLVSSRSAFGAYVARVNLLLFVFYPQVGQRLHTRSN